MGANRIASKSDFTHLLSKIQVCAYKTNLVGDEPIVSVLNTFANLIQQSDRHPNDVCWVSGKI